MCKNEKDQKASFPKLPHGLFINSLVAAYTVCQKEISVDWKKREVTENCEHWVPGKKKERKSGCLSQKERDK